MAAPLVAVGEVLRPHGLSGEVRVRVLTDRPEERFGRLRDCVLWDPEVDRREACHITARHCTTEEDSFENGPRVRRQRVEADFFLRPKQDARAETIGV